MYEQKNEFSYRIVNHSVAQARIVAQNTGFFQ